jgi:pimeloyl-ACP methyl ester carboxylesterase
MLYFQQHIHSADAQWVTFIHGAGGSSAIWYKQIRSFSQHFNLLLIDLRGHGKSKMPIYKNLQKYTFETIGDEVIEVLDHLKIKKTNFIGISLGTIIIRELYDRHPDRFESIIMGGAVMKLNTRGKFLLHTGALLKSVLPYLLLYRFFAFIIMPRKNHKESRNLFVREAKKLYQKEFIRWFTLASNVNPLLKWFRENDISVPTLYVMGAEDHMFLPAIQRLAPTQCMATLQIIEDCGHVVNVERPHDFNTIVINYIKSLRA